MAFAATLSTVLQNAGSAVAPPEDDEEPPVTAALAAAFAPALPRAMTINGGPRYPDIASPIQPKWLRNAHEYHCSNRNYSQCSACCYCCSHCYCLPTPNATPTLMLLPTAPFCCSCQCSTHCQCSPPTHYYCLPTPTATATLTTTADTPPTPTGNDTPNVTSATGPATTSAGRCTLPLLLMPVKTCVKNLVKKNNEKPCEFPVNIL